MLLLLSSFIFPRKKGSSVMQYILFNSQIYNYQYRSEQEGHWMMFCFTFCSGHADLGVHLTFLCIFFCSGDDSIFSVPAQFIWCDELISHCYLWNLFGLLLWLLVIYLDWYCENWISMRVMRKTRQIPSTEFKAYGSLALVIASFESKERPFSAFQQVWYRILRSSIDSEHPYCGVLGVKVDIVC